MRYAILLVPLLALLAACGGDGGQPQPTPTPSPAVARPSPTPEPTLTAGPSLAPSPTGIPTPVLGTYDDPFDFRSFAARLDEAIRRADVRSFLDNVAFEQLTCDEFVSPPSCAGQPSGAVIQGIMVGVWKSEGFGLDTAGYGDYVRGFLANFDAAASDDYGGGAPQFWAYAKFGAGFDEPTASETIHAIATTIAQPCSPTIAPPCIPSLSPERWVLVFGIIFDGQRWTIDHLHSGPVEFLDPVGLAQPGDRYAVVGYTEFYQLWQP